jgi:hypothetical protein
MKLFKLLLLLAVLLVPSWAWAAGILTPPATSSQPITVLSVSGIPFIKASSGTMGNNGAISAMTALPRVYSGGAYLYLPAGAVAAGVPAAATWYWFVASSTTAGTVYNSIYTTGTPHVGTLTAFSTTGPGAYTGDTGSPVSITIPVPGGLMGINGSVEVNVGTANNNSGGNKIPTIKFGATSCWTATFTTAITAHATCTARNRGIATIQSLSYLYGHESSAAQGKVIAGDATENTAAVVNVTITLNTAVATDHVILESHRILVISGS